MKETADIRWLAVGALAGLIAAGFGLLRQANDMDPLPDRAVASVNETLIDYGTYERALSRLVGKSSDDIKADILKRLIDEELLVQRGIDLGMTESDTEVRNAIVGSLIASITAEADAASPDDDMLNSYLKENAAQFSYTSELSVEAWETEKESLAQAFNAALQSGNASATDGDLRPMPDLPPGLMSTEVMRNYLGPAITAAVSGMAENTSAVFARRGRWLVVKVIGKETSVVTDLSKIRNRVLLDYRRSLADELLQNYLDNLRQRADVRVMEL